MMSQAYTHHWAGIEYGTIAVNLSYLPGTNFRIMAEAAYDVEHEETLVTVGYVSGL